MKIIFLDVDGVLNCRKKWQELQPIDKHPGTKIDPEAVARLKRLVDSNDFVNIVVSSTWRIQFFTQLTMHLVQQGIPRDRIIGRTTLQSGTRGEQIRMWLDDHPDVSNYVILDDDTNDMEQFGERFVRTSWEDGLQDEHLQKALEVLR